MKIAIVGASGAVGSALVPRLLHETTHELVLFSHQAKKIHYTPEHERRLTHINGDVLDVAAIKTALQGCDKSIYLVHLMGQTRFDGKFNDYEVQAANNYGAAVTANNVTCVIYVGGMGTANSQLTRHLASRQKTGEILRAQVPQLIEFRTPMIIGPQAAGFEVLRLFVERLHCLPVPRWAHGRSNPITLTNVIDYIMQALTVPEKSHLKLVIGGPEAISYVDIARRYAAFKNRRLLVLPLPFVSQHFAAAVLKRFKSNTYAQTVADMIESAGYSPAGDHAELPPSFRGIKLEPMERAFELMLPLHM